MYLDLLDDAVNERIKDTSLLIYNAAEEELKNFNILLAKGIKPSSDRFCSKYHELMDQYLLHKAKYLREQRKEKRDHSYWMNEDYKYNYLKAKNNYDAEKIKSYAIEIKAKGCKNKSCNLYNGSAEVFSRYFGFLAPIITSKIVQMPQTKSLFY